MMPKSQAYVFNFTDYCINLEMGSWDDSNSRLLPEDIEAFVYLCLRESVFSFTPYFPSQVRNILFFYCVLRSYFSGKCYVLAFTNQMLHNFLVCFYFWVLKSGVTIANLIKFCIFTKKEEKVMTFPIESYGTTFIYWVRLRELFYNLTGDSWHESSVFV